MITFDGVTKRFPDGTTAVADLNLTAPSGRITVLVGSSGCGKTTTLRMINRMIEPTRGRVLLDGVDVSQRRAAALRREIGYVIQHSGLFPHRTIVDNVATVPLLQGIRRAKARAAAMELLERVGLPSTVAKRYPYQLSGGQQQRVGVARALAADPPVLLMDEPFSAVDPVVRAELRQELLRLQGELGKTIVFVTHDVDEAIELGDRIAVFRTGGELVQTDSAERLLAAPQDGFVASFLGRDRGFRLLSFRSTAELPLREAPTAAVSGTVADALTRAQRDAEDWVLVLDAHQRPLGWYRAGPEPATVDPAQPLSDVRLHPCGSTFRPGEDSVRVALDAAVLSASGCAVAVDQAGALLGVVDQDRLLALAASARREHDTAGASG